MKKVFHLIIVFLLFFQVLSYPISVYSSEQDQIDSKTIIDGHKIGYVSLLPNESGYLYRDSLDNIELDDGDLNLFPLDHENEVILIDVYDDFSLIEFNVRNNKLSEEQSEFLLNYDFNDINKEESNFLLVNNDKALLNASNIFMDSTSFIENTLEISSLSLKGYIPNSHIQMIDHSEEHNIVSEFDFSDVSSEDELSENESIDDLGSDTKEEAESESFDLKNDKDTSNISNKDDTHVVKPKLNENTVNKIAITSTSHEESYKGIALNNQTHIFNSKSIDSQILKSYPEGTILKYSSHSNNWYTANVYNNGIKQTGYIHKSHVDNIVSESQILEGAAKESSTKVYSIPTQSSKTLKSYKNGSYLKLYSFSDNWYKTGVYINGVRHDGYILKTAVDEAPQDLSAIKGIAIKPKTHIYSRASSSSTILKSYNEDSLLQFKPFVDGWYIASVYVNGKKRTGFIKKNDIEVQMIDQNRLEGIANLSITSVYSSTSLNSKTLKSYDQGRVLKFIPFTKDWYQANITVNGKKTTGYIFRSHVEVASPSTNTQTGYAAKDINVYSYASKKSNSLKSYRKGSKLKLRNYSNDWYIANVTVDGKKRTGFISKKEVTENYSPILTEYTNYNITLNDAILIQNSQPIVITDKYKNAPAYISVNNVDLTNGSGTITGSVVNIRTTPDTTKANVAFQLEAGDKIDIIGIVKGTSVSGDTDWYEFKQNNKKYYVHSSLASATSNSGTVSVNSANIHAEKKNNSHIYGTLKKGNGVTIINRDSNWHQISMGTWRRPTQSDIREYLDPNKNDKMQHLRLDTSVNVSASQLNNILSDKGILSGKGQSFINGAKKYGVNEAYLISHAQLETGNGTSALAKGTVYNGKTVYNMYGIGAIDTDPLNGGAKTAYENKWFTPEAAIEGGAEWISKQYIQNQHKQNTLYKMKWNPNMYKHPVDGQSYAWKQYATDIGWAVKQINQINNIYKLLNNPTYHYDIVRYK